MGRSPARTSLRTSIAVEVFFAPLASGCVMSTDPLTVFFEIVRYLPGNGMRFGPICRAVKLQNEVLDQWIKQVAAVTTPDNIVLCDGSPDEIRALEAKMVADGTFIELNGSKYPHSFLHRSHPSDVARTEQLTFICSENKDDAGPTNNWMSPAEAKSRVWPLFSKAMAGRTMYVVPYLMGPVDSPNARIGVEITDSAYVVANLRVMTRMGDVALRRLGNSPNFVKGLHSLGDL